MENKRTIKKYANRKLYDTQQSCYITLDEISELIRSGQDILVIDNKSKEDITYRTLIQLLSLLETKKAKNGMEESLYRIIRSEEGTFSGYIKELEIKDLPFSEAQNPMDLNHPSHQSNNFEKEQTNSSEGLSL